MPPTPGGPPGAKTSKNNFLGPFWPLGGIPGGSESNFAPDPPIFSPRSPFSTRFVPETTFSQVSRTPESPNPPSRPPEIHIRPSEESGRLPSGPRPPGHIESSEFQPDLSLRNDSFRSRKLNLGTSDQIRVAALKPFPGLQ